MQLKRAGAQRTFRYTMTGGFSIRTGFSRALAWAAAACLPFAAHAQAPADGLNSSAEYIAAFVRYVHWQGEERLAAWNICIVGALPVAQDSFYADRFVRGKPFNVRRLGSDAVLTDCQVLDLTAADMQTAAKMLERTRRLPILAVGSGSAFCSSGGQICLHLGGAVPAERQKFEVNVSAMQSAALGVSSRLLTLGSVRTANKEVP